MFLILCNEVFGDAPSLTIIDSCNDKKEAEKIATKFLQQIFEENKEKIYFDWYELEDENGNVHALEDVDGCNYYISILEVKKNVYVPINVAGIQEGFPKIEESIFDKTEFKSKKEVKAAIKDFESNVNDYGDYEIKSFDYEKLSISLYSDGLSETIVFVKTALDEEAFDDDLEEESESIEDEDFAIEEEVDNHLIKKDDNGLLNYILEYDLSSVDPLLLARAKAIVDSNGLYEFNFGDSVISARYKEDRDIYCIELERDNNHLSAYCNCYAFQNAKRLSKKAIKCKHVVALILYLQSFYAAKPKKKKNNKINQRRIYISDEENEIEEIGEHLTSSTQLSSPDVFEFRDNIDKKNTTKTPSEKKSNYNHITANTTQNTPKTNECVIKNETKNNVEEPPIIFSGTSSNTNTKSTFSKTSSSTTNKKVFTIFGVISSILAAACFFFMLGVEGTYVYHIVHNGETVSKKIYSTLHLSSYFGGFMIFFFVVAILSSFIFILVARNKPKAAYGLIANLLLDGDLMINLFVAKDNMFKYVPPVTMPGYYNVIDSKTISGTFGFCVFLIIASFLCEIVAFIFAVRASKK